jgi:hypothetical protein
MLIPNFNKLVTHLLVILMIYLLLRVIPKTPLENRDIVIATLSLYVIFIVISMTKEHMENTMLPPGLVVPQIQTQMAPMPAQPVVQPAPMPPTQPAPMPPTQPVAMPSPQPAVPSVEECTTCKVDLKDNQDVKKISSDEGMVAFTYEPKYRYEHSGTRAQSGVIANEMSYTDYNSLPVGANVNSQNSDFSYSFLPPDKWYPIPPHPPVCITEQKCPVCPVSSNSTIVDLKEWDDSRRITPGDVVNTNYVTEKLNSGR